jgi:NAD(P)-dependent dehydrogenase (short-subunit alcohol dehydrogenase family)
VTGSAQGVGRATASALLAEGHTVVTHVRNSDRMPTVSRLLDQGASVVVGDLRSLEETAWVAQQVRNLGRMDAVIHNAGIYQGPDLLHVNVVAPYLLSALLDRPDRLVFLSSDMHTGGRAEIEGIDWSDRGRKRTYSDSKLFVTALSGALHRRWPTTACHAVDPGWVPTRMGGPQAPDDLSQSHVTQVWLAASDSAANQAGGGYWYHRGLRPPHPATQDETFQTTLLASLAAYTGVEV